MPIYEYGCKGCGHTLDALQKMSDAPLVDCPECGEASLKRLLSAPRFRLKGSGWYETDFKKDNQRNLAKKESDGDSAGGAKSDESKSGDTKSGDKKQSESKSDSKSGSKSDSSSAAPKPSGKTGGSAASASAD